MKSLTLIFVVLIALLQYPLWLGKGSWLKVWELSHQIDEQKGFNDKLKLRNQQLDEEVRDLKQGVTAIEERARVELGMVKQDEVFYQTVDPSQLGPSQKPVNSVSNLVSQSEEEPKKVVPQRKASKH
ncbi:MAG: cell division protein FtsB [Candidatus Methylopumilus sp.]|jgi:cell division protein FtsB|nr:cell division protein FtsB [Candidatus Methylopumilus sp.]NBW61046.1 cell division protein FtsB [Methylophilaceae bacterium]